MNDDLALIDPLTGLHNRRAMDRLAEHEFRRRDRYGLKPLALGLIDVDHLKEINRLHFLPAGDRVLVDLAKILAGSVRTVDHLGRNGGDRFLVIAPETNLQGAQVLGERLRANIERHIFTHKGQTIPVRVSIGFAVVEEGVVSELERMKPIAAAALAEAKRGGRNRCVASHRQDPSSQPQFTADDF